MNARDCIAALAALAGAGAFAAVSEKWDPTPLGEPGTLEVAKTLANEPKLVDAMPERPEGIVLFDEGRAAAVVSHSAKRDVWRIADEVRWHLAEMTGRDVELVDLAKLKGKNVEPSSARPVVEVLELDVPSQTAVIRIEGDKVTVGGDGAGLSHAATYFLESLGCRYLWPGKSGKVIPKKKRVALPKIALNEPPKFEYIRRIWAPRPHAGGDGDGEGPLNFMGVDRKAFAKRYAECLVDRKGNRGFWVWHGFGDRLTVRTRTTKKTLQDVHDGGHYFDHYYKKYSAEHPDWFALQPDGTRVNRYKHPRLCLSNEGLIQEVIRDRIEFFRKHPEKPSASLCMPDGDRDSVCLCEGCRRLDPVNAPRGAIRYYYPERGLTNYVSFTDRVLWFCNRVAEGVLKECPGKQFKTFIYAGYVRPPVKVKPHPSLVLFNVAGNLTRESSIGKEVESIAAFAPWGNTLVWRPNMLDGFRAQLPQNYSRIMYDDTVRFKENNVRGVSFDCCSGEFALKGLAFYMIGRALLNYDNLSYEGQLNDYCSCFGAAARDVRGYFDALERVHMLAVKNDQDWLFANYPLDDLAARLDRAAEKVADDPDSLGRVRFLQKGITIAREEMKLYKAWYTTEWKPLIAARKKFKEFVQAFAMDDPVALPCSIGPFMRGTPRRTPEQAAYYAALAAERRAKQSAAAREAEAKKVKGYTDGEGNFQKLDN